MQERQLVEIGNPMSAEWSVFRADLFPELLEFLSKNSHRQFPQKVFEAGRAVAVDSSKETGVREELRLCLLYSGKNSSYNLAKSLLDETARLLSLKVELVEGTLPCLESGKSVKI